jgi:hypothetical protein
MYPIEFLYLIVIIALPIAWLISEFYNIRSLRIVLGILALLITTFCIAGLNNLLTRFSYNESYGSATKNLIETSLRQIEDGHLDHVLKIWRGLNNQYHPTYENQANYQELSSEATAQIRGDTPTATDSSWDAQVFGIDTWVGHWENDTGYWLVIHDIGRPLDIIRSGDPPTKMHSISLSKDCRVLKFQEGAQWLHTLTLKNKYEASHEWFDQQNKTIWDTDTMHKLIRASAEQKRMTQQDPDPDMKE